MLPQSVRNCLRDRGYYIMVGSHETLFAMDVLKRYDSHDWSMPGRRIFSLTYDEQTGFEMSSWDGLDGRLAGYIKDVLGGFRQRPSIGAVHKLFSELSRCSGRFEKYLSN